MTIEEFVKTHGITVPGDQKENFVRIVEISEKRKREIDWTPAKEEDVTRDTVDFRFSPDGMRVVMSPKYPQSKRTIDCVNASYSLILKNNEQSSAGYPNRIKPPTRGKQSR